MSHYTNSKVFLVTCVLALSCSAVWAVDLAALSGWDIVVSPTAPTSEIYAAQELQSFLSQAGAPTLPIVTSISQPSYHIFVGYSTAMAGSNVAFSVAGFDAEKLQIMIGSNNIAIAGGVPRGTLYGVYTFLEDYLGVRFLTVDHTYVPVMGSQLLVGSLSRSYQPPFGKHRACPNQQMYENHVFATRARTTNVTSDPALGGKTSWKIATSSFYKQVPYDTYGPSHPEYFALWDGVRQSTYMFTNLCMTNTSVKNIITDYIMQEIQNPANSWRYNFDVVQNDNLQLYCTCSACRAIDETSAHMAALLKLVNSVATTITASYPNAYVNTQAYGFSRKPPANVSPGSHVVIELCSIEACQLHSFNDPTCPTNASFLSDLQGWHNKCTNDNLFMWTYGCSFYDTLLPYPNLYVFKPNIQTANSNGVKGMFIQLYWGITDDIGIGDLRNYLIYKLMWNPSLDTDTLIDEFVNLQYGNAAPYVRQYIDRLHNYYSSAGTHNCSNISGQWALPVDYDMSQAGVNDFKLAINAAENSTIKDRVEKASVSAYRAAIDDVWKLPAGTVIQQSAAAYLKPLCVEFFRLCDKFGVEVSVHKTRIYGILAASLPYPDTNSRFEDNFNDRASLSILNGTNGWVDSYDISGNICKQAQINANRQAVEKSSDWGTGIAAGAGRNISGEVSSSKYEVRMCFYGQVPASGYYDLSRFSIGDNSLIQSTPYASRNCNQVYIDAKNRAVFLVTVRNGEAEWSEALVWDLESLVWGEVRITVDMDTGIASAWWHDVEDTNLNPMGDGLWTKFGDFPGTIPYTTPTAASFSLRDYARADNFRSGYDPASCAEAISQGYTLFSDFNGDCKVDFADTALMSLEWLRCMDPADETCETPWWN